MEAVREQWTDARLDDFRAETARRFDALGRRVDDGFNGGAAELRALRGETKAELGAVRGEMKTEFAAVRNEMKTEFAAVRAETKAEFVAVRGEMNERFEAMQDRLEAIHRMMFRFCCVAMAALLGVIASLVGVVVQL